MSVERVRCGWAANASSLDLTYHDEEWGVPVHEDARLFEMITLEGAQAGLSWSTILKKREGYREAFQGFDAEWVARMTARDVTRLLKNPDIVRHRGKIESTIANAKGVLAVQAELGSLDTYVWSFVDGRPLQNRWRTQGDLPSESVQSQRLSKDLKKRGFRFVGPTTMYAFMQAAGLVNDHEIGCFRVEAVGAP